MQAYEHIMADVIMYIRSLNGELKGEELKRSVLEHIENYAADMTFADSWRPLFPGFARQYTHATEGFVIELVKSSELKDILEYQNGKAQYPSDKMYNPNGVIAQLRPIDYDTDLGIMYNKNGGFFACKDEDKHIEYMMFHLVQDTLSDSFFQDPNIVNTHPKEEDLKGLPIKEGATVSDDNFDHYGLESKNPPVILYGKEGNTMISSQDFRRKMVDPMQKIVTYKLYVTLRDELTKLDAQISFKEIDEAVCQSYKNNYPDALSNASAYAIPFKIADVTTLEKQLEELEKKGNDSEINKIKTKIEAIKKANAANEFQMKAMEIAYESKNPTYYEELVAQMVRDGYAISEEGFNEKLEDYLNAVVSPQTLEAIWLNKAVMGTRTDRKEIADKAKTQGNEIIVPEQ